MIGVYLDGVVLGVSVPGGDELLPAVVEHPQLALELGLVQDVAEPAKVGRDLQDIVLVAGATVAAAVGQVEVVGELELVGGPALGNLVPGAEGHDLGLGGAVVVDQRLEFDFWAGLKIWSAGR